MHVIVMILDNVPTLEESKEDHLGHLGQGRGHIKPPDSHIPSKLVSVIICPQGRTQKNRGLITFFDGDIIILGHEIHVEPVSEARILHRTGTIFVFMEGRHPRLSHLKIL